MYLWRWIPPTTQPFVHVLCVFSVQRSAITINYWNRQQMPRFFSQHCSRAKANLHTQTFSMAWMPLWCVLTVESYRIVQLIGAHTNRKMPFDLLNIKYLAVHFLFKRFDLTVHVSIYRRCFFDSLLGFFCESFTMFTLQRIRMHWKWLENKMKLTVTSFDGPINVWRFDIRLSCYVLCTHIFSTKCLINISLRMQRIAHMRSQTNVSSYRFTVC